TDRGRRFDGIDVSVDPRGALTLWDAPAWMTVRVHDELPAGDHDIVLLRVEEIDSLPGAEAIVFHHSRFKELAPADVTVCPAGAGPSAARGRSAMAAPRWTRSAAHVTLRAPAQGPSMCPVCP